MRETLKASYSHTGRPSIDPEVLLRILLIGYLYGITSERRLVEDVGMHLAYRWFTGLGFDQEVPHHSTFSKNRHGRFQESPLFLELFERIVQQCMNVGLLKGVDLSVDSTQIRADASPDRTITREQLPEVAKVNRTVREYVEQVERENVIAEPEQTSDPSASEAEGRTRTAPHVSELATDEDFDDRSGSSSVEQARSFRVRLLRQLSDRQSKLHHRGRHGNPSTPQPRNHCGPADVGKSERTVRVATRQRHC